MAQRNSFREMKAEQAKLTESWKAEGRLSEAWVIADPEIVEVFSTGVAFGMERKGNANLNQRKREIEMKTLPAIVIGLMASLAIGITTARGQVMYSLEDLGVVKDMDYSMPAAINNTMIQAIWG